VDNLAKIIHFPQSNARSPNDFLTETFDIAKEEEIESIVVSFKLKNGEVMTGYFNADFGTRQEICGHIQCDIVDQMILANLERYGE